MRRLGGTARKWRTDRLATVIVPGTADVQRSFAPVAKHYGAIVTPRPPRRGNRKGAVECGVKFCCGRWWRTMGATTMAEGQLSLDHFWSSTGDARLRPPGRYLDPGEQTNEEGRPHWPSVGELAEAEALIALPAAAYPATIEVHKIVDDKASVAFRGNRYSVAPGLGGVEVTVRHRLGTGSLEIFSPAGRELVSHPLAHSGAGAMVRTGPHRAALEAVVLSQHSTALACDRKANKPPGAAARAERDRLLGGSSTEPSVDLDAMAEIIALAFPGTTEDTEAPA